MYTLPGALAPLANYPQFILVQLTPATDKAGNVIPGKSVKHPIHPQRLLPHNAHDPAIWMTWQDAAQLAERCGPSYVIGFVITEADDIVCLDIDSCATLQGTWNDDAQELMRRFPGAVELSLSGQGLHVWGRYRGKCPPHGKRKATQNIELYSELRFIALGTTATGTMYDLTDILPGFIADYFPFDAEAVGGAINWTTTPVPEYTHISDEELLHRALSRTRPQDAMSAFAAGPKLASFSDLWTRNVEVLSSAYPPQMAGKDIDASSCDVALAKELAYWTGKDCARIERLMQQSALKRDKWLTHRTYLRDTIMQGTRYCTAVHHVKPILLPTVDATSSKRLVPTVITHETFIGREGLARLFDGCVYVQDDNEILLPNGDLVDQARFNAKFAGYAFGMDNNNEKTSKSAWEAFLGNQIIAFPRVEGTAFDPSLSFQEPIERAGRTWVNIYKKPEVDRRPGDVTPFMTLLKKLLPNGDDAVILLSYMAAIVQYPGVKFRWAPFIQGTRGNGKSTLIECLKHALGNKYIFTLKAGMIENGFNSWLEKNLLYIADDIYSTRDRQDMMEALKSMITGRDHAITLKGIDSIQKHICGNFMFTDNHKDAMKKQDDTRDICTLYCAQQSKHDRIRDGLTKQFFTDYLRPWLENGGFAFVAEMLHTMPIDPRYNPAGECQEAPDTSMTAQAVDDGATGLEAEVKEWIEMAEPGFTGDFISSFMLKKKLEGMPRQSTMGPLKMQELLGRIGYEPHRALPKGRTIAYVMPDNYRPVLFVKRDVWQANLTDVATIETLYTNAQNEATTAQTARMFNNHMGAAQ